MNGKLELHSKEYGESILNRAQDPLPEALLGNRGDLGRCLCKFVRQPQGAISRDLDMLLEGRAGERDAAPEAPQGASTVDGHSFRL
jgi:hypothetical protein